jgi:hypothetical protein
MRQADAHERLPPRCLHRPGKIDHVSVHTLEAHHGGHDDRKEAKHECADDLGNNSKTEPDDEKRRDSDLRHALREDKQWVDETLHSSRIGDQERYRDSERDGQAESPEGRVRRRETLAKKLGPFLDELNDHIPWSGDY